MAEEAGRRLPRISTESPRKDTLESTVKDSISRLQSSIRQGLALNRAEIKATTTAITLVNETLAKAFNVNEQLIEIEKEKMRLDAERQLEEDRKAKQDKSKSPAPFIKKLQGGIFDVLKKLFFGAAIVGAVMLVAENWQTIKDTFEKIKPTLVFLKDKVVEFAEFIIPKIIDNFDLIVKGAFAALVGLKVVLPALKLLKAGFIAIGGGISTAYSALLLAKNAIFGRRGLITKTRLFARNAKRTAIAMGTAVVNLAKGASSLASAAFKKIVTVAKALRVAMVTSIIPAITGALASLAPIVVAAAPIAAIAAGAALVLVSLNNAIKDARDTFEETGSVTEAIKEGLKSLFANIVGLPIKLLQSVGRMVGLLGDPEEQAQEELEEARKAERQTQFKLKMNLQKLQKAKAEGNEEEIRALQEERDALNQQRKDQLSNIEDKKIALEEAGDQKSPVDKIKGFLDSLDPEAFLKNLLQAVLPTGTSVFTKALQKVIPDGLYEFAGIDKETGEQIPSENDINGVEGTQGDQVRPVQNLEGAEVDTRSREVEASKSNAVVTVTAPQTNVQQNTTTNNKPVTVTPASPRRSTPSPQSFDVYGDPSVVF